MISLTAAVACSRSLVLYKDADDPALFYYVPRYAELGRAESGGVHFQQRMCRRGSSEGVSTYVWTVQSVIPESELEELAGEMREQCALPVRLEPIRFWPSVASVGVTVLAPLPRALLMCRARTTKAAPDAFTVMVAAAESAEPDLAEQFMNSSGVEISLECKVTGASTPFRGTLQANFDEVQRRFRERFGEDLVSWPQMAAETEVLLSDGALRLRVDEGEPPLAVRVSVVTRYLVNRLTALHRAASRPVLAAMHGAWFRVRSGAEPNRRETVELAELDMETRALPVLARIGSVPRDAFQGLDGRSDEVPPKLAQMLDLNGIRFVDGLLVRQ